MRRHGGQAEVLWHLLQSLAAAQRSEDAAVRHVAVSPFCNSMHARMRRHCWQAEVLWHLLQSLAAAQRSEDAAVRHVAVSPFCNSMHARMQHGIMHGMVDSP